MQYDPIKRSLGKVFNASPLLRILFYKLLDLLLLRAWHIKKELKQWSKGKADSISVVDAGSGFGQYVYFLSTINKNWKIKGLDIKEEQIADCNQFFNKIGRKNIIFEYADLTKFTEPESFDLAINIDVMEHIEDDVQVMTNLYKSLKPGGMLLINTPSDQGGSDVHDHDEHSFIDEHVRDGYNIEDITVKLKKAGFSKIDARYTYGAPGNISWHLSMKYPILMLNASKLLFILLPFYYLLTFPFCLVLNYLDTRMHHTTGTGLSVKAYK